MGAKKGLTRATLKFTQKQLPGVLESRKKNKHMKIKAKQAVQSSKNREAKGAPPGCALQGARERKGVSRAPLDTA
jgi:hypothetical protein